MEGNQLLIALSKSLRLQKKTKQTHSETDLMFINITLSKAIET